MPKLKIDPKILREDGLVTMHFLGSSSRAMWFVPGYNHAYEAGVDLPYFVVLPEHVEALKNFVYKNKKLFEVVPPDGESPDEELPFEDEAEEEDEDTVEGAVVAGSAPKKVTRKPRQTKKN